MYLCEGNESGETLLCSRVVGVLVSGKIDISIHLTLQAMSNICSSESVREETIAESIEKAIEYVTVDDEGRLVTLES